MTDGEKNMLRVIICRPDEYAETAWIEDSLEAMQDLVGGPIQEYMPFTGADEGYTNLNDTMEADFSCLTKLRAVLHRCGEAPFLIDHDRRVSAVTWQRC